MKCLWNLVEAGNFVAAQDMIAQLQQKKRLSPYELAQILNLTGYSYNLQERYTEAIGAYARGLQQPDLPEALQFSMLKIIAQLQFAIEDYEGALTTVRRLLSAVAEPGADELMLEGKVLLQLKRYKEALTAINTALDMRRGQGLIPRENSLLLLHVCYFELKDYENMIQTVKEFIAHYPKDGYLMTLASIYSELGDTRKQLVLTEVLYEAGYASNPSTATNLANLYLMHGLPYKSALLLEKELEADLLESNERTMRHHCCYPPRGTRRERTKKPFHPCGGRPRFRKMATTTTDWPSPT